MKREIVNNEKMYDLASDDDGVFYLSAVCGGAGMYEVTIRLTPDQVVRFHDEGADYIDDLAYRMGKGEFKDQIVRNPTVDNA